MYGAGGAYTDVGDGFVGAWYGIGAGGVHTVPDEVPQTGGVLGSRWKHCRFWMLLGSVARGAASTVMVVVRRTIAFKCILALYQCLLVAQGINRMSV